ncbi:MAG: serine hydrolase domain-containing protein [Bacteroidota bacterium]
MRFLRKMNLVFSAVDIWAQRMRLYGLGISIALYSQFSIHAQSTNNEEIAIDSIFSEWQNKQVPGVVAGLIYGETVNYTKAFGYADVKNNQKNTVQTKFQIGYLSRQFVVFGILVLENHGKLSLEDTVQKYLPDFPEYEHQLTLSHLVNHSSGLNDFSVIRRIIGVQTEDAHNQENTLRLIKSQKALNFKPGTDFSHFTSQTEIALLLEIIEKASGKSVASFMTEEVFKPLGMENTIFVDDDNTILDDKAISYQNQGDTLKLNKINFSQVFYTTAEDMQQWYRTLTGLSKSTLSSIMRNLDNPVTLKSGEEFDSWWGKLTLGRSFYHLERGLPAFWQFGRVGGYASNVFRFPEQKLISFVFGNNNVYNGMPAMLHANYYILEAYTEPSAIDPSLLKTRKVPASGLRKYEGHYWDSKRGIARKVVMERDTLFYKRLDQEEGAALIPLATPEMFQLLIEGDEKIVFRFKKSNGKMAYDITLGESSPYTYVSYTPMTLATETLEEHAGSYYNRSLKVLYEFEISEKQLIAKGPKDRTIVFHPVMKDTFRSDALEFGSIRFKRDANGSIQSFNIFTDGIQNLEFIRMLNDI